MNPPAQQIEISNQLHTISALELDIIYNSSRLLEHIIFNLRVNLPLINISSMESQINSLKELSNNLTINIEKFEKDTLFDIDMAELLKLSYEMQNLIEDYCQENQ